MSAYNYFPQMHCKYGTSLGVFYGGSNVGYLISVATVTVRITDMWKLYFWAICCKTAQQFELMFTLMKTHFIPGGVFPDDFS